MLLGLIVSLQSAIANPQSAIQENCRRPDSNRHGPFVLQQIPYTLLFRRRGPKNISAYYACPVSENGMAYRHRTRILPGSIEGIVSKNTGDVGTVTGWLVGLDVETALQK